ncbi:hypothetical protein N2599_37295 (plasmid) [Rhizobium sullae]|uniref:PD-(D/E)XK nuclease superfamily protein n=1 Tax=Rhizobium sullae TaxID=50338 RepID=A0ABY5XXW1_RHISU|nr:hypothetical protein [Rhizobium sullae]UWU19489.1 hypothetical protein N2599_37295 [Rhizobium sullae]
MDSFSSSEQRFCEIIRGKDRALRDFLSGSRLPDHIDAQTWLTYLTGIKSALGNLNNDLAFVATLLVKRYLQDRFGILDFDAAGKAQGAAGVDIEAITKDGKPIVGELKTTKPYEPGFGAQQRTMMLKDLKRWQLLMRPIASCLLRTRMPSRLCANPVLLIVSRASRLLIL